jgi:hypothetical protein
MLHKIQHVPELAPVKTQQPIPSEEEHRVLEFRPRTSTHAGLRAEPSEGFDRDGSIKEFSPSLIKGFGKGSTKQMGRDQDALHEANDLSRYERVRDEPDDFRHRMLANVAAFAFTIALIAVGIWLAKSIADFRNTQDCVLMGRRDCARIATPHI